MGDKPLSLNGFRQYILAFKLEHYPEIQINPVAFKQFAITEVPALVVAQPVGDSLITETGCAPQSLFAVVYGDIPVDYALEKIQEKAEPTLSGIANQYLKKGG
jgi:type-F conjugative transfer system pilin assembly protein TrbC